MVTMRTPAEWCRITDWQVLDPDGWRRDGKSWDEPITEVEFWDRLGESTIRYARWHGELVVPDA